jgi:DNA-directed RNA polymerase specialized sigma subunit
MILNRANKERIIENYLRDYNQYRVSIINCQKQLEYISPTLVSGYNSDGANSYFYIANNTEGVAIDRIEGRRAVELHEEIAKNKIITESINRAVNELAEKQKQFVQLRYFEDLPMQKVIDIMGYAEQKSAYHLRKKVLDKFLISLNNLIALR